MPTTEPSRGYRLPTDGDTIDVPGDMANLAADVAADVASVEQAASNGDTALQGALDTLTGRVGTAETDITALQEALGIRTVLVPSFSSITGIGATPHVLATALIPDPGYPYTLISWAFGECGAVSSGTRWDLNIQVDGAAMEKGGFSIGADGEGAFQNTTLGISTNLTGAHTLTVVLLRIYGSADAATYYNTGGAAILVPWAGLATT